ncbi:MAG: hypothetical protein MK110_17660 [Fuerstiella sp.]|nr:hypothetical protein [Fuerstiella sp.]
MSNQPNDPQPHLYTLRHIRLGWCLLVPFLVLGFGLEACHGLKVRWYLEDEVRRLMWTLAHTHGTLLSVLHICFAVSLDRLVDHTSTWVRWVSMCLVSATILMPGGFFLGGVYTYEGDPGLGIWLVPVGATLLIAAIVRVAAASLKRGSP